ncbi:TetR/AcrR family transcriptional regulator [Glaciihabitans sp. dw_435]|uniref:TetR/AcrR family transcriptional regulator n=1 Tax=Glaciihabitans sp. dw_435 TaxID=2720081 RepID=UPI001BD1FEC0|nr:TetR/AcrR family transcriptional regulator [Glaciihabitans sp. dw_435]
MSDDERPSRARRSDAILNNQRLVQAAREVFAEQGLTATLQDIAAHAGVGVGTIYRNFDSKQQIIETLYEEAIEGALAGVHEALEVADPWQALVTFFEVTASNQARDRGLTAMFLGSATGTPLDQTAARILDGVSPLFDRARAAGVAREGIGATDILPIFAMLDAVYRLSDESPDLWRRYLVLLLDGLRAKDRPELPVAALDDATFRSSLGGAH